MSAAQAPDNMQSTGFPMLERFLEQEPVNLKGFQERQAALQNMSKNSKSAQEKAAAKQALLAYSNFLKLIANLIKIKEKIQKDLENSQAKKRKK